MRILLISMLLYVTHSSWAQNMYSTFGKGSPIRKEYTYIAKPPALNQPLQDEQIVFEKPLNITFKWSPRYQDGTEIEYEFILKELPENIISPKTAYTRGIEVFRTTTRRTTLHYSHLEPTLRPNKRYGWQVKVVGYDTQRFENNGFSEVGWFTVNNLCSAPQSLNCQITLTQAQLSWSKTSSEVKSYILTYRQKPKSPNNQWSTIHVYGESTILPELKLGKTYQWRVGIICENGKPLFSSIQEFTIPDLIEKSKIIQTPKLKNNFSEQQSSPKLVSTQQNGIDSVENKTKNADTKKISDIAKDTLIIKDAVENKIQAADTKKISNIAKDTLTIKDAVENKIKNADTKKISNIAKDTLIIKDAVENKIQAADTKKISGIAKDTLIIKDAVENKIKNADTKKISDIAKDTLIIKDSVENKTKNTDTKKISDIAKDTLTIKDAVENKINKVEKRETKVIRTEKTAPRIKLSESGLSGNFAKQKGNLPIPVTGKYSIVTSFGKHQQSKYITTNSNGIDIQAQAGANALAVFDGEVSNIISFPGFNTCIIIRHGNYYTFYGNLRIVRVHQGQSVKIGQNIGSIFTNPESGITKLHFQLWDRTNKQNPIFWLRK